MVRDTDHTAEANHEETPPGRGPVSKALDTIRGLLTDPPHDPGTDTTLGRTGLGWEWK